MTKKLTDECHLAVNYIIKKTMEYNFDKSYSEQIILTIKRIQKILYLSQILYMNRFGKNMFEDEFYAWPSGPAIPVLYDKSDQLLKDGMDRYEAVKDTVVRKKMMEVIDSVLNITNNVSALNLVKLSTTEESPWSKVYSPNDENHKQLISKEEIYNYSKRVNPTTEFLNCSKENITIIDKVKTKIKEISKINCN